MDVDEQGKGSDAHANGNAVELLRANHDKVRNLFTPSSPDQKPIAKGRLRGLGAQIQKRKMDLMSAAAGDCLTVTAANTE